MIEGHRVRDTEMLECRRVGNIVTDVKKHRDTAMLINISPCR